jgi:hypothetical protein
LNPTEAIVKNRASLGDVAVVYGRARAALIGLHAFSSVEARATAASLYDFVDSTDPDSLSGLRAVTERAEAIVRRGG